MYYHGELLLDKKKDDDFLDDEELVVVQGSSSTSRGRKKCDDISNKYAIAEEKRREKCFSFFERDLGLSRKVVKFLT